MKTLREYMDQLDEISAPALASQAVRDIDEIRAWHEYAGALQNIIRAYGDVMQELNQDPAIRARAMPLLTQKIQPAYQALTPKANELDRISKRR